MIPARAFDDTTNKAAVKAGLHTLTAALFVVVSLWRACWRRQGVLSVSSLFVVLASLSFLSFVVVGLIYSIVDFFVYAVRRK